MSNTSSSSSINFISINQAINRYVPMPLLFFGIIGNILNVLIFTRKIFRHNICVNYFFASTIFNFFAIIVGLLPRLLNGYGYDRSQSSAILCKLRFFISYHSGYTSAWFISLACVERYLSSSTDFLKRQMITLKRAYLSMIIVILLGFIIFGEHFYCININQQQLGAPQSCYQLQQSIPCQVMDSILQFFFEMLTPALMMIIFGLLTLENVRQHHRRIKSIKTTNILTVVNKQSSAIKVDRTAQKRDSQLITMLLVQVSDQSSNIIYYSDYFFS